MTARKQYLIVSYKKEYIANAKGGIMKDISNILKHLSIR